MGTLKRYRNLILAVLLIPLALQIGTRLKKAPAPVLTAKDLPRVQTNEQLDHALELNRRRDVYALLTTRQRDLRPFILKSIRRSLTPETRHRAFEIARVVITEANSQHLDPLFLLAVIQTESGFNLKAKGRHGEIGLMQVMPGTAAWLGPQLGLGATPNLHNPRVNIRIGAAYFARLRRGFDGHTHRYVAAYNMGARNVRRLLATRTEPKIYPKRVLANYQDIYAQLDRAAAKNARRTAHQIAASER